MSLNFNMLLADAGLNLAEVRLLRHQTSKVAGRTPYSLWRDDPAAFVRYQSTQNSGQRARFNARCWASFVAPSPATSLFVGLFSIRLVGSVSPGTIDPFSGLPVGGSVERTSASDQYECILQSELSEYIGRLSIQWGDTVSSRRAWVQRADNQAKEIVELTRVFVEEAFPGFTKLILPLSDLETMPASWKAILSASKGVYLLACPRTREHYVGSAYGQDGFIGRWRSYVANAHGGNIGLRIRDPSDYVVSVLEVAGSSAEAEDIIALETIWKKKLFSRDIGLNRN